MLILSTYFPFSKMLIDIDLSPLSLLENECILMSILNNKVYISVRMLNFMVVRRISEDFERNFAI